MGLIVVMHTSCAALAKSLRAVSADQSRNYGSNKLHVEKAQRA